MGAVHFDTSKKYPTLSQPWPSNPLILYAGETYCFVWYKTDFGSDTVYFNVGAQSSSTNNGVSLWYGEWNRGGWKASDGGTASNIVGSLGGLFTTSTYSPYLYLTPTSSSITMSCPDLGIFTPLCDGLVWMFVHDQAEVLLWKNQINTMAGKVPFGYLTLLSNEVNTWAPTSTEQHLTFDYWVPAMPSLPTTTMDVSQAYLDVPESLRTFANTWLVRILWLGFLAYLVARALSFKE
jgi:hypothetical protein